MRRYVVFFSTLVIFITLVVYGCIELIELKEVNSKDLVAESAVHKEVDRETKSLDKYFVESPLADKELNGVFATVLDKNHTELDKKFLSEASLTVLSFWDTDSPASLEVIGLLEKMSEYYPDVNFVNILVNEKNSEKAIEIWEEKGIKYYNAIPGEELLKYYKDNYSSLPETVFLSPDGKFLDLQVEGKLADEIIYYELIDAILAGRIK